MFVYDKRSFITTVYCMVKYPFTFNIIWYKLIEYMGFLEHLPGKAGDQVTA